METCDETSSSTVELTDARTRTDAEGPVLWVSAWLLVHMRISGAHIVSLGVDTGSHRDLSVVGR